MPAPSTTRIIMPYQNNDRALMTILERSSGDLYINIRPLEFAGESYTTGWLGGNGSEPDMPFLGPAKGTPVKEYRYSIHVSDKSATQSSTIKLTRAYDDDTSYTEMHFTTAVKSGKGLDPLFARICPSLELPIYDFKAKNKDRHEVLSQCSPCFTPLYMVLVAAKDSQLSPIGRKGDFRVKYIDFSVFRVVVLWSFLTTPMLKSERWTYFSGSNTEPRPGCGKRQTLALFNMARQSLGDWYIDVAQRIADEHTRLTRGNIFYIRSASPKLASKWPEKSKRIRL